MYHFELPVTPLGQTPELPITSLDQTPEPVPITPLGQTPAADFESDSDFTPQPSEDSDSA